MEKKNLTQKQTMAIMALMDSGSKKEAARKAGIGERTLRSYFENEAFLREYSRLCNELYDDVTKGLAKASLKALETLQKALEDESCSWSMKITSARIILENSPKYKEFNEIVQIVEELERERSFTR